MSDTVIVSVDTKMSRELGELIVMKSVDVGLVEVIAKDGLLFELESVFSGTRVLALVREGGVLFINLDENVPIRSMMSFVPLQGYASNLREQVRRRMAELPMS